MEEDAILEKMMKNGRVRLPKLVTSSFLCRAVLSKSNEIALLKYVEMSLRITYG
jgi:hypothetical protein